MRQKNFLAGRPKISPVLLDGGGGGLYLDFAPKFDFLANLRINFFSKICVQNSETSTLFN